MQQHCFVGFKFPIAKLTLVGNVYCTAEDSSFEILILARRPTCCDTVFFIDTTMSVSAFAASARQAG